MEDQATSAAPGAAAPQAETDETAARAHAAVDLGFGVFFAMLSGWALLWLIPAQISTTATGTDVAPAFMAQLSATVVLVLSVLLVAQRLWRARPAGGGAMAARLLGDTAGLSLGAVLVMTGLITVGFLPTAACLILAGGVLARHRPRIWLIPLAILFPLLVDAGAWRIFWVDLP